MANKTYDEMKLEQALDCIQQSARNTVKIINEAKETGEEITLEQFKTLFQEIDDYVEEKIGKKKNLLK